MRTERSSLRREIKNMHQLNCSVKSVPNVGLFTLLICRVSNKIGFREIRVHKR